MERSLLLWACSRPLGGHTTAYMEHEHGTCSGRMAHVTAVGIRQQLEDMQAWLHVTVGVQP